MELGRRGRPANHKRVERLMAAHGIVARRHRHRRCLTKRDEAAPVLPDLVGRLFDPDDVDHTWVGDVTCVATGEGWPYLASVLDLGSRRLLGYSMSATADTAHARTATLRDPRRGPPGDLRLDQLLQPSQAALGLPVPAASPSTKHSFTSHRSSR